MLPGPDPEHWRSRAEEMRSIAAGMRDPDAKATMLRIADECERLARRTQEQLGGKISRAPARGTPSVC
jgi:hypothetical protein